MSWRTTKPTKWLVRPGKTQISLGIRPVWSESSLSAWSNLGSLATHWAHSKEYDQTGRMPRLIWVFGGHTCHFIGFVVLQLKSTLWKGYLSHRWIAKTQACLCISRILPECLLFAHIGWERSLALLKGCTDKFKGKYEPRYEKTCLCHMQTTKKQISLCIFCIMSHNTRNLSSRVCNQIRLNLACSATEASKNFRIVDITSIDIIFSRRWTTKTLISLRGCVGWSVFLLFANGRSQLLLVLFGVLRPFHTSQVILGAVS